MSTAMRGLIQYSCRRRILPWAADATEIICNVNYVRGSSPRSHHVLRVPYLYYQRQCSSIIKHFSTSLPKINPWEGSLCEKLLDKINYSLNVNNVDEAWEAFKNYKRLYGIPKQLLVNRMIISLSYTSDRRWLRNAYDLVHAAYIEKPALLDCNTLSRLALTLGRTEMPILASTVLRIILEIGKVPSTDILSNCFMHMVKKEAGSYLAAEVLIETCKLFLNQILDRKKKLWKMEMIKPNITLFNLVLDSCVRFGCVMKAQEIIGLMPMLGIVADANSMILIARVYEKIGRRDELKQVKEHIDRIPSVSLRRHYQQFYDSLLSLHFGYNDIDAAVELLASLYQQPRSLQCSNNEFQRQFMMQIGSGNLKTGYQIRVNVTSLEIGFSVDQQSQPMLVDIVDGKLVPTEMALAKLINRCRNAGKIDKLSNFLIGVHTEANLSSDVISTCIQIGWLDAAHDILDDMESAGVPLEADSYTLLLRAYMKENKSEESNLLLKQIRKAGITIGEASAVKSQLPVVLAEEIQQDNPRRWMVYEFNNSILFFCNARMMEDALRTFKRMRGTNIRPTSLTYGHLMNGYSSLKMYREITILWGEMRRDMEGGVLTVDQDLLDCLLMNFLRGGFFERVMEIIGHMSKHNIYCDKWKYRSVFLKFHKDLYRNLKASQARTDAQSKRLEDVRAFRAWANIENRSNK